MTLTSKK